MEDSEGRFLSLGETMTSGEQSQPEQIEKKFERGATQLAVRRGK